MAIPLGLGRDVHGTPIVEDLAQMPHLLVAGATGSGKSVCLNAIITTILMLKRPEEVKLLLVDPKMIEMTQFKGVPHLISPVVTDMKRAAGVLEWAVRKMDERYRMISAVGVRDIARFNRLSREERLARVPPDEDENLFREPMPYVVIVVDELADLMMVASKEIETSITRLAHKARGIGVHIVFATQRPSVDVITGLIKANLPARLAFQVSSKVDSRTILDQNGAEKLTGRGDFLFLPPTTSTLIRARGVYVSDEEIARVAGHVSREAEPEFLEELAAAGGSGRGGRSPGETGHQDDLFEDAVRVVLTARRASVSLLQRKLAIGYTRAAKLVDMMADRGLVGPYRGAKPREIYTSLDAWEGGGAPAARGEGDPDEELEADEGAPAAEEDALSAPEDARGEA
jgi:S-DNA-T family DNA segregation ATPase FtsK/SpoIIIE